MDAMNILGALIGIAVGAVQLVLLSGISAGITGVKKGGLPALALAAIKLGVYLLAAAAVLLFFRDDLLFCGIGYAVGMLGAAVFAVLRGGK